MTTTDFATLDLTTLSSIHGGQAGQPQQPQQPQDEAPQRSWGQVAREYGAACVTGAAQSLMMGGRPRSVKDAAISAATGCAMGVGMKAVDDVSGMLAGNR